MATKTGILFLSHQGFSFLDDLMKAARRLGLESYVLSSQPAPASRGRSRHLRESADCVRITRRPALTQKDIERWLCTLARDGREVRACLSVWEGYRMLMADTNSHLNATDVPESVIRGVLDKHVLRQTLGRAGLSRVKSTVLTPKTLGDYLESGAGKFLKPRFGLGSFGAFRLGPSVTWKQVEGIREEMKNDYEYASLFGTCRDFIAEDYIAGIEVSFETLVVGGTPYIMAAHEKVEVEQKENTFLENASACPPPSISKEVLRDGEEFLAKCLKALGLDTGCYHLEAKYDSVSGRWEIIEINPRVGGALIKESVHAVSGGLDLLEAWIRILLAGNERQRTQLARELDRRKRKVHPVGGTFFKVYFGEPGRAIRHVKSAEVSPAPAILRVVATVGSRLPSSSREIFLGQAMWTWKHAPSRREITKLKRISNRTLEVSYEA